MKNISLHMFLEFCYSLILGLSQTKETVTKGDILNASTGVNFKESLKKLQDLFPHFDWENSSFDTIRSNICKDIFFIYFFYIIYVV
jgi:hypothetical protein